LLSIGILALSTNAGTGEDWHTVIDDDHAQVVETLVGRSLSLHSDTIIIICVSCR